MSDLSIVIDGHTASGKTTLALALSRTFGFQYIKPFDSKIGDINKFLFDRHDERLSIFRSCIVDYYLSTSQTTSVYDRLTPSTLSLLPVSDWPLEIPNAKRTFIVWCDIETTLDRLTVRGRNIWSILDHKDFIDRFRMIADRYNLPLIDTTSGGVDQALDKIIRCLPHSNR